ncbi:MAG: hypothetical protein JRD02_12510 [Deltaproteobacteria bacterium]|nr:hypothetical protein [Deltaproteobacteria bacterium]
MNRGDKKELARDLRGRQSVRATFKLTEKAIDAISIVAAHLGIKQKSLFDHLIDDTRSLKFVAGGLKSDKFYKLKRIQKTYVLSRKTMLCLEEASRNLDAPRDALVEYSIQRLMPVIEEEREKHLKHKKILDEITEYLKQGKKILKKSSELLGEDDPVYDRFENAMTVLNNAHSSIESFIEKGNIIESF